MCHYLVPTRFAGTQPGTQPALPNPHQTGTWNISSDHQVVPKASNACAVRVYWLTALCVILAQSVDIVMSSSTTNIVFLSIFLLVVNALPRCVHVYCRSSQQDAGMAMGSDANNGCMRLGCAACTETLTLLHELQVRCSCSSCGEKLVLRRSAGVKAKA
jgi:ribosomal protein S27E